MPLLIPLKSARPALIKALCGPAPLSGGAPKRCFNSACLCSRCASPAARATLGWGGWPLVPPGQPAKAFTGPGWLTIIACSGLAASEVVRPAKLPLRMHQQAGRGLAARRRRGVFFFRTST